MEEKIMDALEKILGRLENIESQQTESIGILKALEYAAEVNKAEHDSMKLDIAEIKGEVSNIRKDLSAVEVVTANNWSDLAKLKSIE